MERPVRVYVRARPRVESAALTSAVTSSSSTAQVFWDEERATITTRAGASTAVETVHQFDAVIGPGSPCSVSQTAFYAAFIEAPLRQAIKTLQNLTILAYGQTGSGKTHTVVGGDDSNLDVVSPDDIAPPLECDEEDDGRRMAERRRADSEGVAHRCIRDVFYESQETLRRSTSSITVSFLEIYNEELRDLLAAAPHSSKRGMGIPPPPLRLRLRADGNDGTSVFFVDNLTRYRCETAEEAIKWFKIAAMRKATRSHALNSRSSRSHSIFTITVTTCDPGDPTSSKSVEINIVDLAGSEKISAITSGMTNVMSGGMLLTETAKINASLLCLSKVIDALAANSSTSKSVAHVPYRDSKLTSVLRHALSHNAATILIACANPAYPDETIRTLAFASRARTITASATLNADAASKNTDPKSRLIAQLKLRVSQLEGEVAALSSIVSEVGGTTKYSNPALNTTTVAPATSPVVAETPRQSHEDVMRAVEEARAEAARIIAPLTNNLVMSCERLSAVVSVNAQLRKALDALTDRQGIWAAERVELENENQQLRERVSMLEQALLAAGPSPQRTRIAPAPKPPKLSIKPSAQRTALLAARHPRSTTGGMNKPASLSLLEAAVSAEECLSTLTNTTPRQLQQQQLTITAVRHGATTVGLAQTPRSVGSAGTTFSSAYSTYIGTTSTAASSRSSAMQERPSSSETNIVFSAGRSLGALASPRRPQSL